MGGYNSPSSSRGSTPSPPPPSSPPRRRASLYPASFLGESSASSTFERIEHPAEDQQQQQQQQQQQHPQIPTQSFVGLGSLLRASSISSSSSSDTAVAGERNDVDLFGASLSASASIMSSVTGASNSLLMQPPPQEQEEEESKNEPSPPPTATTNNNNNNTNTNSDTDGFEYISHLDPIDISRLLASPLLSPATLTHWLSQKLDDILSSLLNPKSMLRAFFIAVIIYWRLRLTNMERQAHNWENKYHEEHRLHLDLLQKYEEVGKNLVEALEAQQQAERACVCVSKSPTIMPRLVSYGGEDNVTEKKGLLKRFEGEEQGEEGEENYMWKRDEIGRAVRVKNEKQQQQKEKKMEKRRRRQEARNNKHNNHNNNKKKEDKFADADDDLFSFDDLERTVFLDNCFVHLEAGDCTKEAINQVVKSLSHVCTFSESVYRSSWGMAQGLFESVEGFVGEAATKAEGLVEGIMNHLAPLEGEEEEEEVEGGWFFTMEEVEVEE